MRILPVLDAGLATLVACCVVEFRVVVGMGDDDEERSFDTEGVGVRCEVVEEGVLPRRVGEARGIRRRPTYVCRTDLLLLALAGMDGRGTLCSGRVTE